MRRVRVDPLRVEAADHAGLRHGDDDVDLALEPVAVGELQVVPAGHDRRLAARLRGRGRLRRDEVARRLEIGEELDARADVVERPAVRERRRVHRRERLAGLPRVAAEGDHVLVLRILQVGPVGRRRLGDVEVGAEPDDAPVVADPVAGGILERSRDGLPVRVLEGQVDLARLADLGEGRAHVHDVRGALRALQRRERGVLLRGGAVRDGVVQLELVRALEGLHDLAVVRPGRGQRDRVDRALLLGGGDQRVERRAGLDPPGRGHRGPDLRRAAPAVLRARPGEHAAAQQRTAGDPRLVETLVEVLVERACYIVVIDHRRSSAV